MTTIDGHSGDATAWLPLTQSQLLIWTGQRLQPDDPLYNMVLAFEVCGHLEPTLFQQAFQALVDRTEALRMVVDGNQGQPRQRFLPELLVDFEFVDLAGSDDVDAELGEWLRRRSVKKFDLDQCLFDSVLLRLGPERYCWYFNQHHLATDATSTAIVYRRMQEFYALAREGRLEDAPSIPDYREYITAEAEHRESPAFARAQRHWQDVLETPLTPSQFFRQTPVDRSGRTERTPYRLSRERSQRLKILAESRGFQALTTDLAHFQIFATVLFACLYRLTGNRQLAIGTPTHNRVTPQFRETPGLFIEVFPVRIEFDDNDTFTDLHRKVSRATQQFLINAGPGISSPAHNRAYDVLLNYITASFGEFDGMPMHSEWVHAGHGDRNHLLRLQVHDFDREDEFLLHFDLNIDTFVGDERSQLVSYYARLLDAMLSEHGQQVADVPLLTTAEWRDLDAGVNGVEAMAREGASVVTLFEGQVAQSADSPAVVCDRQQISYRELNARANQLAGTLLERGVTCGSRVGVFMTRSIDVVISVIGILKSGAAYLPIDPQFPQKRVAYLIADGEVSCVLTQSALMNRLPPLAVEVLAVDAPAVDNGDDGVFSGAEANPGIDIGPDQTCYLIYTSGSTGQPKGVLVRHGGLANYLRWARHYYLEGQALDFPLFTSLAFDLTVTSLFLPLVSGGRLVVYQDDPDAREIVIHRVITDNAVDIVKLTPSHLALLQTMDLSTTRIRKLIVGGEDFKTELARNIHRRCGGSIDMFNEYGPTEGTVACMVHRFDDARDRAGSVPIGGPIDNARVYVLDQRRNPVPPGIVGELYIGGTGVASGYLHAPELTAERFVPDPFAETGNMYATGDVVRWHAATGMQYLGRQDDQVKIQGVRVDLGEIETAILDQPDIDACAVTVRERRDPAADEVDEAFCVQCGLSSRHPDAHLDAQQVCHICRAYEAEPDKAHGYFGNMAQLERVVSDIKADKVGDYDAIALLSGGKDSSYALCRLVDMGLEPLVFTLDNGFISEGAKENIRRLVDSLGLDLHVGSTSAMNAIFVDSLQRHSNVCQGCFKTIYTLSMNLARQLGIGYIFTGLSRGQIFETRLADLFRHRVFDPGEIDRTILDARKAYHRQDDEVARRLDTRLFDDDQIFDQITFVDFYRYCDVGLDEVLDYLDKQAGWKRPKDTGRSTNCLINELGIYVHKRERGFHNYALPYSWDVRLGHKQRDAAREELQDNIDVDNVQRIMADIGYDSVDAGTPMYAEDKRLVCHYVASQPIPRSELRARLAERLPREVVPTDYIHLERLPLTDSGKVDRRALPEPGQARGDDQSCHVEPKDGIERQLAEIWQAVIGVERVGRHDNFFEMGGDSILNIQIVAKAKDAGLAVAAQQIFDYPTVAQLAGVVRPVARSNRESGPVTGELALTPIQERFFAGADAVPRACSQAVLLKLPTGTHTRLLTQALEAMVRHHDGLRSRFFLRDGRWWQRICGIDGVRIAIESIDASGLGDAELEGRVDGVAAAMHGDLDPISGPLWRLARFVRHAGAEDLLLIVAHHLVVDAVSWWILLDDLRTAHAQLAAGAAVRLPDKSSSVADWSHALQAYSGSTAIRDELDYWREAASVRHRIPLDHEDPGGNDLSTLATVSVALNETETRQLLRDVPSAYNTQVPDVLLTALTRAFGDWTGNTELSIDLEAHGREESVGDLDLLRTVGWFTAIYPVRLDAPLRFEPGLALKSIKEQLRVLPNRGIGYGVLRYLGGNMPQDPAALRQMSDREVLFNYLGQWGTDADAVGQICFARPITASYGSSGARAYVLEINAVVFGGRLITDFAFSTRLHEQRTIEALAANYRDTVLELILHCLTTEDAGLTPSDVPHADIDQDALDDLIAEFGDQ